MTDPIDPVTSALTGKVPFYLLLTAALTFPIAIVVLRVYARAVGRSMRQSHRSRPATIVDAPAAPQPVSAGDAPRATLYDLAEPPDSPGDALFARMVREPRRAALVYTGAGAVYGAVMAASQLLADGLELLPVRFLFLTWIFSWPIVLTIGVVAATTRLGRQSATAAYFLGLIAIGAVAMSRSPDLTWGQILLSWVLYDLPATVLLLMFLSRRIRAIGPLILT